MAKTGFLYPRDKRTGSIPQYASQRFGDTETTEWLEPAPITGCKRLTFTGFERGRSAAHAQFINEATGSRYTVFLTDLGDLILHAQLHGPLWTPKDAVIMPCKRGSNFGVRMLTDAEYKALTGAPVPKTSKRGKP